MTDKLSRFLDRSVPRYTSYPTAPHFTDRVTATHYQGWLRALDPSKPVSLYLHVPYCKKACWYCGCNMKLAARPEPVADYAEALIEELRLVASHLPDRMRLSHLHWGGGTPTALDPLDLARTMDEVRRLFELTDGAELAIESDPRTLTDDMAAAIGQLGLTRASFGVQEFDPQVQAAINRIQPPEMVERAVTMLRAAGTRRFNFDLIYGLPYQDVQKLLRTVELCTQMGPDRIALFGYAHVPWTAKRQRMIPEEALPGPNERLEQSRAASEALVDAGYIPIGIDHFALPDDPLSRARRDGNLRRNFQGYTDDQAETMIGVGCTAIGRTPMGFVQNIAETGAWARAVRRGELPVAKGHQFKMEDILRGAIIEDLMCYGQSDVRALAAHHGMDGSWAEPALSALAPLEADGLVICTNGCVRISNDARPLARIVASAFDRYRSETGPRHSVAV